jgi:hypothetical protein
VGSVLQKSDRPSGKIGDRGMEWKIKWRGIGTYLTCTKGGLCG